MVKEARHGQDASQCNSYPLKWMHCKFSIMDFSYAPPHPHHHQMHRLSYPSSVTHKGQRTLGMKALRRQAQRREPLLGPPRPHFPDSILRGLRVRMALQWRKLEKETSCLTVTRGKRKVYHPRTSAQKLHHLQCCGGDITRAFPKQKPGRWGPLRPRAGPAGCQLQWVPQGEVWEAQSPKGFNGEDFPGGVGHSPCRARQPGGHV